MRLLVLLAFAVSLSGCSRIADSKANPLNWFGNAADATATGPVEVPSLIPNRASNKAVIVDQWALITRVNSIEVNNASGGVLVTAKGQPARAGGYNLDLVPAGFENGVLTLEFKIAYPQSTTSGAVTPLTSSRFIKDSALGGVRQIRVVSAQNSLSRRN